MLIFCCESPWINVSSRPHASALTATRSPKDSVLYDTDNVRMRDLLTREIAARRRPNTNSDAGAESNADDHRSVESLNIAFVKASNRFMACETAADALALMRNSDRIVQVR
jgi:hypothetical protein